MRSGSKRLILLLLLPAVLALIAFFFVRSRSAPDETQMLANFRQHKAVLQILVSMARQDNLTYLGDTFGRRNIVITGKNEWKEVDISKNRQVQYRALMEQSGVHTIAYQHHICRFIVFAGGFTDTSWTVGYAWAQKPVIPMTIVPSAYYDQTKMRGTTVYSEIENGWFIYRSQ